ncbi:MAG: IS66 family transposase [Gemmataceae bacterium]
MEQTCQGCRERDARIAALEQQLAELQKRLAELEARTKRNSSNSSVPPSANPPGAPPPVTKKKSKRGRGGQPKHPPHLKKLVPPERVKDTLVFVPERCEHCEAPLPQDAGPNDPPPTRHQVAELPALTAEITEYQGHARTCPCCREVTRATIPAEIRAHSCGPRLTATLSYLSGVHKVSRRGVEEIADDVFDAPIALGTVSNLEEQVSAALAPAHAAAMAAVRAATVKNVDETSWKERGQKRWLWTAATATVAVFLIHAKRSAAALIALLGERIVGFLISDRWSAYGGLSALCRQVCWAHLKRDFQKCVDRGGPAKTIGEAGLALVKRLFKAWHTFRGGGCTRLGLQHRLEPVAKELRKVLERGRACADAKAAQFCVNLLGLEPALWRFAVTEGVEPTNNHAERVLRHGVLWRKNAFGCNSERGCRFVERMLTVLQTLRLQGRNVLHFLVATVRAHRAGQDSPKLVIMR